MDIISLNQFGKYYLLTPNWYDINEAQGFLIDSNYVIDVFKVLDNKLPKKDKDGFLEDVTGVWKAICHSALISFTASAELSWNTDGVSAPGGPNVGFPRERLFAEFEDRFQKLALANPYQRQEMFSRIGDLKSMKRYESSLPKPNKFDRGTYYTNVHEIIYQLWASVLILMRFQQAVDRSLNFDARVKLHHQFMHEIRTQLIGMTPETLQLARFVFFDGTVAKINRKETLTSLDFLKVDSWKSKGVTETALNVAFDLLYIAWIRRLNTGTFQGQSSVARVGLVTGDKPLATFAGMLHKYTGAQGEPVIDYKYPDRSLILEHLEIDQADFELYQPYVSYDLTKLKSAKELRTVLPKLAKQIQF